MYQKTSHQPQLASGIRLDVLILKVKCFVTSYHDASVDEELTYVSEDASAYWLSTHWAVSEGGGTRAATDCNQAITTSNISTLFSSVRYCRTKLDGNDLTIVKTSLFRYSRYKHCMCHILYIGVVFSYGITTLTSRLLSF